MRISKRVFCTFAFTLFTAAFLTVSAHAQNIFGSIVGTVSDPSGAVLPGASVTVTDLGTSAKRTVTTDGRGNYSILSLPRGNYRVDVDDHGFKHFSRSPINVAVDQQVRVDVKMQVGSLNQQVVVNAAPPVMQTESASLGQVIQGQAVTTLPLNGRNVLNLIALVPGVVPQGQSSGSLTGKNVFAAGNYQIGGGAANQSSVLVDGAPTNTMYGNAVELVMDQDAVQEFKVQTHNNTAEFGNYNGGVVNMITKSGTNRFHGTAYEYVRNTIFDANDFFANREGIGRQSWHQNQFGANVGGPIVKNKAFFFVDYAGYRQTEGYPFLVTVPTANELTGDFSGISAPIYDPLTTCGYNGNPACTAAQQAGTSPTRQQFSYGGVANVIPPSRLSTVAMNVLKYPLYAKPNIPGTMTSQGPENNFATLATAGGNNDQFTIRSDQNLSSKDIAFERWTWWRSKNVSVKPFGNGLIIGDPNDPEAFTTNQLVVGNTYVLNPTNVFDVHLAYLRWNYVRTPAELGINESSAFGWPGYMDFGKLNDLPKSTSLPDFQTSGPISYTLADTGYIFSINNQYDISATYQRVMGQHTFKFGLDLRQMNEDYYQNNDPGGVFRFNNDFTASRPGSPNTGNPLASIELGYDASGTVQISPPVFQRIYYQGYFGQDTWQVTPKLTATLGLRYEVPGTFLAGHGWESVFNPTETNPIVTNNGAPVPGAYDLVNTPQHPSSGATNEVWTNWEPRLGFAYRVTNNTVVRAGWGEYVTPVGLAFYSMPLQAGINFLNNLQISTTNGGETPATTLDDPYPGGLLSPPHRDPSYQQILLGGNPQAITANQPSGKTYQWNTSVEHQFLKGIAVTATYAGMLGDNLPISTQLNSLPDSVMAQAASDPACSSGNFGSCFLNQKVPNPFYPLISQGVLQKATVTENQLLRPFPEYGGLGNSGQYSGISNYEAFDLKVQKRMSNGGMFLGSYTFSKNMTNAENLTSWLDGAEGYGTSGWQDYNNPGSNYSLSSFDARQRLVVSYVYPLPLGHGQRFLANMNGVANTLVGGWGLEGITSFQKGFPLGMSVSPNIISTYGFQGRLRPDVKANCGKAFSGSIGSRIGGAGSSSTYFNTVCFTQPKDFSYGTEPRNDNTLRTPGVDNWDMSLFKNFPLTERATLNFRVEAFNLFNRVRFGSPNTTLGSNQFGWITRQSNFPRILQMAGRITF